jgi:uncharacterized protein YecE (DUF72 family)
VPEFFALLREYNVAFVFADTARRWPYAEDLTADFVYVRLHGDEQLYVSGYSPSALDWWAARVQLGPAANRRPMRRSSALRSRRRAARRLRLLRQRRKVHAPFDAQQLAARLQVPPLTL